MQMCAFNLVSLHALRVYVCSGLLKAALTCLFFVDSVVICCWLQGIDLVIKSVEAMVQPMENLDFPIFEKSMAPQWQAIKVLFTSSNENIKDATRELIDVSFR